MLLARQLLELQRRRRDFIDCSVVAARVAMDAYETSGCQKEALSYANIVLSGSLDLFYADPLRDVHSHYLHQAVRDAYRLAVLLGDVDCIARVRSRMGDALELARLVHLDAEELALCETLALEVGASVADSESRGAASQR